MFTEVSKTFSEMQALMSVRVLRLQVRQTMMASVVSATTPAWLSASPAVWSELNFD